jgi:hypothetical protein
MAIWGCGLPAGCCQPAVAGGVIYADLWGELSTHLAPQALFTQSSPVHDQLLQAFLFPSTLGEVTLHLLSQAGMFIYSSRGKWAFPLLLWIFPPTAAFTSFSTSGCWACATAPAFSSPLFYLQFREGFPSLPFRCSGHPTLFDMCLIFFCYCLFFSFSFSFFPGVGVGLSRELCWSAQGCLGVPHTT